MTTIQRTILAGSVVVSVALLRPADGAAQDVKSYSEWVRQQVNLALAAEKAIAENGNGVANQKESPSIDGTSGSLVDTSAASDFASLALNLSGLRTSANDQQRASGSITATLYSLVASARGVSLTDPAFYRRATPLRRVALTLGSEESTLKGHFTDKPATSVGAKVLLLNSRDVYSAHARRQLGAADSALESYAALEQLITNELQCIIFRAVFPSADRTGKYADCTNDPAFAAFLAGSLGGNWPNTQRLLERDAAAMREVTRVIGNLAAGRQVAGERITAAIEQIQRGRQLAIAYFTKQREDDGTDDHRTELIFDYGISERLNWTLNASFDYSDRKQREDTRRGRMATEFQSKLSDPGSAVWNARPVTLSGGAEAAKDPEAEWLVRAQAKLLIPVMAGVDIPIAYTYTNRDADGITAGSQLKMSLSVDPVRLRERLR